MEQAEVSWMRGNGSGAHMRALRISFGQKIGPNHLRTWA